jgi:MurNAc alpha-1-phosphate uridylyltransferase
MKALILAAGRGERMRPLTDDMPKPLLSAGDKPLVEWHLERLAAIGVRDVVLNTSWLADRFPVVVGDGSRWGLRLHYLYEGVTPLETGGGMRNALPLLGDAPFIALNGDIWTDFDFGRLPRDIAGKAHLVLVDNPPQHPHGDFGLDGDRVTDAGPRLTFSGIGIYRPSILDDWAATIGAAPGADETPPRFKLAPLLYAAIRAQAVTGVHHRGAWTDVGTPLRLRQLDQELRERALR